MKMILAARVFVELALIENFCMDFTLLYCAKLVTKNPSHVFRVILASVIGACFAVVFPLLKVHAALSYALKIISGAIICAISGKFTSLKAYLKLSAVFLGFTFLLGGALIALFSLAKIEYTESGGSVLSSVPIGIPMFLALILIIFARKLQKKLRRADKSAVTCKISVGERSVSLSGFYDSGNSVYYMGQPVSVIPLSEAVKIIDFEGIKEDVKIHTVAGSKKIKVFTADKIEVMRGDKNSVIKKAKIGISPNLAQGAVLHPDLMEE